MPTLCTLVTEGRIHLNTRRGVLAQLRHCAQRLEARQHTPHRYVRVCGLNLLLFEALLRYLSVCGLQLLVYEALRGLELLVYEALKY
jgi:hypothetical protein